MKVYIVLYNTGWWDGDIDLEGVFSSDSLAEKWINEQSKPDRYNIAIREVNE